MVLPGIRGDQRTPGGMPDSGSVNPGGPVPSVPQGTRQPNMGAGVGEPDPKKIEDMFTQYTTGQITREDLFNFLHAESEGRGGILGLLETIGQQSEQSGSQPIGSPGSIPPQPQPQPAAVENGKAISPGAASVQIPSLEEPLDKRHQKISMMLQGYGLGPADADQMSTILNEHYQGNPQLGHPRKVDTGGGGGAVQDWDAPVDWRDLDATQKMKEEEVFQARPLGGGIHQTVTPTQGTVDDWDAPVDWRDLDATQKMKEEEVFQARPTRVQDWDTPIDERDIEATQTMREAEVPVTTTPTYYSIDQSRYADTSEEAEPLQPVTKTQPTLSGSLDDYSQVDVRPEMLDQYGESLPPLKGADWVTPTKPERGAVHPDGSGRIWDGVGWVQPEGYTGVFGDVLVDPSQLGTFLESVSPELANSAVGKFMASGAAYSKFAGGNFGLPESKQDQNMMEKIWGWIKSGTNMQDPQVAQGWAQVMPHQDPETGEWFPTQAIWREYQRWSQPGQPGSYHGGGKAQFSHWELNGKEVPYGTSGAKGVAADSRAITVKTWNHGTQSFDTDTYYFPESHPEIDKIESMLQKDKRLPWDEAGNAWTNENEGYLSGYGPNGLIEKTKYVGKPVTKVDPATIIKPGETLPPGWIWQDDGFGNLTPYNPKTGTAGTLKNDGTFSIPAPIADPDAPVVTTPPTDPAVTTTEPGFGPTMTDLDLRGAGNFPMMNDFLQQLQLGNIGADAASGLTGALAAAITTLEVQKSKGDVAADQRMADVVMNDLDRVAVTARADADRKLQQGAALGKIEESLTLAAKAEQNKAILEQSKISGLIPTMGNDGLLVAGTKEGLESRVVTMTETEKNAQRKQNMAQLFGTWMEGDPTSNMETIEKQKFGLTKAITEAEMTGKIPTGYGTGETLAAKRMAWEQDVARQNANTQTQLARNGVRRNEIDLQIAQNKISSDEFIAGGQLAEAVEARKDATFLAKQKLDIEREKMKLDTLTALANPATYLFAVRYGLLEQIGGTLGISWGDDAITSAELPTMVAPGTFPSMTEFQNATLTEREIMLAEVASSGGFTTDEAVRRIMEGAPGGRDIRRTSLVGVTR